MADRRITPLEIEKTQFSRSLRGYSRSQVDEFFRALSRDYESALAEINSLKQELSNAQSELMRFRETENTLKEALILAQKSADETRVNARKEAELTVQEARQRAYQIEEEARQSVERLRWEIERLRIDRDNFVVEFRSLLNAFLTRIERMDIEPPAGILEAKNGAIAEVEVIDG